MSSHPQYEDLKVDGYYLLISKAKYHHSGRLWYIIILLILTGVIRLCLFAIIFTNGQNGLLITIVRILARCGIYRLILTFIHRIHSLYMLTWTKLFINRRCISSRDSVLGGCKPVITTLDFSMLKPQQGG